MISHSWPTAPLASVVDVLDSRRVPVKASERAARGGTIPYYGATGRTGTIDQALFNEPLVLLGEDGAPFFDVFKAKAYLIDGPSWVNNHVHVLRPQKRLDRRFLKYYLDWFDYRGYANGTTRLKLTQAAMKSIPIPLPCMDEQIRVVEILEDHLSRLDAAADYVSAASRRLVNLHESSLRAALTGYEAEYRPLGELLAMPLTNGRSVPTQDAGFPVLRLTALSTHGVDLQQRKGGAWTATEAYRFLVSEGDFLIGRGNGSIRLVGRGSLVRDRPDPVAFPDTIIRARPNPDILYAEYLDHVWNSQGTRRQIESMARTTAGIYKVNQKQLGRVQIPVPSLGVQSAVASAASSSRQTAHALNGSIESVERRSLSLRRAVLSASFRGELTGRRKDHEIIEEHEGAASNWQETLIA